MAADYTGSDQRMKYLFRNGGGGGASCLYDAQKINDINNKTTEILRILGGGGGGGSSLTVYDNLSSKDHLIDLDTDSRFTITFSGNAWSYQSLFTYDGNNMYSAPTISDNGTTSAYIKNTSGSTIFLLVVYKSSTEGPNWDYGSIINNGRTVATNIGGSVSGETSVITLSDGATLTLQYRKDGSTSGGLDNVGMLLYELGV